MFTSRRPSIQASIAAVAGVILFGSLLAAPGTAATYNEPGGLFSITVPSGWSAKPLGRGEWNVSNGHGAFVHVVNVPGAGTDARPANQLIDRVRAQWQKSERLDGGPAQLGGQRGFYVTFAGVNPAGIDALLRVVAAPFGNDGFVLLISAPVPDYAKLQGTFKDIERSFTAGDGRASAPAQQRQPPARNDPPDRETSRVVTAHFSGAASASQSLGHALRLVARAYDAPPTITAAVRDADDTVVRATFRARQHGTDVGGLLMVVAAGGSGFAGAMSDMPARFAQSYPTMSKRMLAALPAPQGGGGGGPAPVLPMRRVTTPGGTAQIDLPASWRISDENQGAIDVEGPNGEGMSLGIHFTVLRPGVPLEYAGQLQAPYGDMHAALNAFLSVLHIPGSQILEEHAVRSSLAGGNSRAAFVLFQCPCVQGRCEGLASIQMAPVDQTHWYLYQSSVAAPVNRFPAVLPTLLAAWKSWSVNPAVTAAQISDALRSMGKVRELMSGAATNGTTTTTKIANIWGQALRGEDTVQHEGTGAQSTLDAQMAENLVKRDPTHWHIVPASQIRP